MAKFKEDLPIESCRCDDPSIEKKKDKIGLSYLQHDGAKHESIELLAVFFDPLRGFKGISVYTLQAVPTFLLRA